MPAISLLVPPEKTYNFVHIRNDLCIELNDAQPYEFHSYDENKDSCLIGFRGVTCHALFLRSPNASRRASATGWQNITEDWYNDLESSSSSATTPGQQAIVNATDDTWRSKKEIMAISGIKDSEWRTAIKTLMDRNIIECNFSGHARKRASNRRYRYRLVQP
jgi:hypothetical protein